MNVYMQLEDIYSAIDKYKIFFNIIKQGLGGVASDLDITKACKVIPIPGMIISKDEFIMSHVSWWPMRWLEKQLLWLGNQKGVGEMYQGMAWWWGETFSLKMPWRCKAVSVVLFFNWSKYENIWVKGLLVWQTAMLGK